MTQIQESYDYLKISEFVRSCASIRSVLGTISYMSAIRYICDLRTVTFHEFRPGGIAVMFAAFIII